MKYISFNLEIVVCVVQVKYISFNLEIVVFKEEKGVGERRINCSIIPKYNETQQKSYIH